MAQLIEFYIPTNAVLPEKGIPPSERGKIIEFRAREVMEVEAWLVAITREVTQGPPAQLDSVNNANADHPATAFANALDLAESR
ncbi:MAG: hypothetical protein LAO20_16010 [Acidobacteriia bacterium]|nr:hypothetical protein [Terriglobia bacterium]